VGNGYTGTGIDPEILPRLFSKFGTKSHGGTGLGLYISKNIVEAHDGELYANNNTNEKRGATFTILLPLLKQQNTSLMMNFSLYQNQYQFLKWLSR
jgi:signal transduction histidine kinase